MLEPGLQVLRARARPEPQVRVALMPGLPVQALVALAPDYRAALVRVGQAVPEPAVQGPGLPRQALPVLGESGQVDRVPAVQWELPPLAAWPELPERFQRELLAQVRVARMRVARLEPQRA